ncbi:hypothetical protein SAMD00079811_73840 [Scytonema sp. HK-05]|nr:hypothetical protein SAMD00079811_73840 [Scytonema sp. HK-05]
MMNHRNVVALITKPLAKVNFMKKKPQMDTDGHR